MARDDRAAPAAGAIEIDALSILFGSRRDPFLAVDRVSARIAPGGEFVCLLGPSGCGKSTVMNAVAGFETPSQGQVRVGGEPVTGPGADRGMVFQQPTLFPWKTVRSNVAHGPRMRGLPRREAGGIADGLLAMVGLAAFAGHYPHQLSGAMQQRTAIARALASEPDVLLMDEPFGALDAQTRLMMQENLLGIWADLRPTVVFVTHDIDEAVFLADRILVMSASPGRILDEITVGLARPRDTDIALGPDFAALKRRCVELIRGETLRAFEQQGAAPG